MKDWLGGSFKVKVPWMKIGKKEMDERLRKRRKLNERLCSPDLHDDAGRFFSHQERERFLNISTTFARYVRAFILHSAQLSLT